MKIPEAIIIITKYINMLRDMDVLSDDELEELMKAESTIFNYMRENRC